MNVHFCCFCSVLLIATGHSHPHWTRFVTVGTSNIYELLCLSLMFVAVLRSFQPSSWLPVSGIFFPGNSPQPTIGRAQLQVLIALIFVACVHVTLYSPLTDTLRRETTNAIFLLILLIF